MNLWKMGKKDEAINLYRHKETKRTEEQNEGIRFHKRWEDTIRATKKLSIGRTRLEFENPEPELKVHVPYREHYILSAIFDCVDGKTLYEFKTGSTSTFEYATNLQIPYYFFILSVMNRPIKRAFLIHWDQYKEKGEVVIVKNSAYRRALGLELVDTIGAELYSHLEDKKLL